MPIVAIISLVVFPPWDIVWAWLPPLADTVHEEVDDALDHGLDGIVVYVQQADQEPVFYSAGWKNRENRIAADPQALFKIASISKLYIAVAVAKLAAEKRLPLNRTLAEYLPELAGRFEHSEKITLRLLVQHRSGIYNYTDHPNYPWDSPYKDNMELSELVFDVPANFEPDTDYEYSNTNYWLIGLILDKVLGYSHHQYIKEVILNPLGLKDTYSLLSEVNLDDLSSGYFVGYEPDIKYNDMIHPGGSMIATIGDVGVFIRALNDGSLLTAEEQDIYRSIYRYGHTGLLPGFQSIARYHKDIDAVLIQFVNTSGGHTWEISDIVYNRLVRILHRQ